ncbi:DNA-3-methyladenine glycosylase I [Streptomyces avicenniae]|uniref:DNA-3-methyladenine glycosylase I n=1 Tax=Streptomyces avicenniae TaxID=500153 RepID=UPI00069A85DC|nr:DNA-3-methyladenine glycosylase I [Streptomyces avicenniae]
MDETLAVAGADGLLRCPWGIAPDDYRAYHDTEWGVPVRGDRALFERMSLEAFQSGLSWLTILRRREGFRAAFADFDAARVAAFAEEDVTRLLQDPGIIRNRLKIEATVGNAAILAGWRAGELTELIWSYAPDPAERPVPRGNGDIAATTPESTALSKELRRRGLRFVGPTTAHALMQSCGLVNDHLADCHFRGIGR